MKGEHPEIVALRRTMEVLGEALRHERERSQQLLLNLLELKREGFAPAPPSPEPLPREPEPEGWGKVLLAVADRADPGTPLYRAMRSQADEWRRGGMSVDEIAKRIYRGMEV